MVTLQKDENGFSIVHALLMLVIAGLVGFTGWYVWDSNNNATESYNTKVNDSEFAKKKNVEDEAKKYLNVPELGIKFELNDKIQDAYYYKNKDGDLFFSVHKLDQMKGAEDCVVKPSQDSTNGVGTLKTAKIGGLKPTFEPQSWTQQELDESGYAKVGDTYYYFMKGQAPCHDSTNEELNTLLSSILTTFVQQSKTITEQ